MGQTHDGEIGKDASSQTDSARGREMLMSQMVTKQDRSYTIKSIDSYISHDSR